MATFLSVPLKRTWEVDLIKPLQTFILDTYTAAKPDDYKTALEEFNKQRNTMISKQVDKHESALEVLYRYYDQLVAIETKLPISENQIRISFKWQDAFDKKEGFFSGKRTQTISSSGYEKVCVLFNIAALQSQVACAQNLDSDEGMKSAAKMFQLSSGIFAYLRDCVMSHVQNDPTPDLHPDTLGALSSLMLAQAQDCFVRKSMNDKMKPMIVAKLAHQASDFYADALKLVQLQSIRELWPKDWVNSVASKQAAYHGLAEFFQSQMAKDSKDFGEQISRLRHAKDLLSAAETRGGSAFIFGDQSRSVDAALKEAEKDNNFIYHAKIPDVKQLAAIGKAPVAKLLPVSKPMTKKFNDLFAKVVPLAVHQSLVAFEAQKSEFVNQQVGRLREATTMMNGVLASLNLPAAIEDLGGAKVPQSVLEKSAKIRELGGINYLRKLITDMPELLTRNREILDEAVRQLDEEEASDRQLREQFKDRWTRTPSEKLTDTIRAEATKYRTIIDNAMSADGIVKERYGKHESSLQLLSKPEGELANSLPSGATASALMSSTPVVQLKNLVEQVNTLKAEREVIESELKNKNIDMAPQFLAALSADGAVTDAPGIACRTLDGAYCELREQVGSSLRTQEDVLQKIQHHHGEFSEAKRASGSAASRDDCLKDLAAAFDSFMELKSNIEEGTKFYNDLTQLLVKFSSKVSDLVFARKTEKEELLKDLNQSIARAPSATPPTLPAYQATDGNSESKSSRVPPPRPPPPSRPQTDMTSSSGAPMPTLASAPPAYGAAPTGPPGAPPGGQAPYPNPPYPVAPPMPSAYNPYAQYGYPAPSAQTPYPPQSYPGYAPPSGYPPQQQQWRQT